jgi:hypothetical protein
MTAKNYQVGIGDNLIFSSYDGEFHDCQAIEDSEDLLKSAFFSKEEATKIKEEQQKKYPKAQIGICPCV